MGRLLFHHVLWIALVAILISGTASASGAYRGRPAGPSVAIDRESYELGKHVYSGRFAPIENPGAESSQRVVLEALQTRLPVRARNRVDLPSYAGRLSDEQMAALKYFLRKRFKVE